MRRANLGQIVAGCQAHPMTFASTGHTAATFALARWAVEEEVTVDSVAAEGCGEHDRSSDHVLRAQNLLAVPLPRNQAKKK